MSLEVMLGGTCDRIRTDFAEKSEKLIKSYNSGSRNIEQLFQELVKLSTSLDHQEKRHVRKHLSQELPVVFDILTRPAPELSAAERDEVKTVPKDLLFRLKQLLVQVMLIGRMWVPLLCQHVDRALAGSGQP